MNWELESKKHFDSAPLPAVFLVSKWPGMGARGTVLEQLGSQAKGLPVPLASLSLEGAVLRQRLVQVLERQGLTGPEARALHVAWDREFFATDGLRALTVIPQWLYDAMLPIEIDPKPGELVRVGIIWREGVTSDSD